MDTDMALILGLLFAALSVPSILSAFSERRPPRVSAIIVTAAAGLIAYALIAKPGGYRIDEIPQVFFRVLGRFT